MSTCKEKIYTFIKSLITKYGEAFPSFPTLAKVAGCSSRHATALVKQLEEEGRIRRERRFTQVDGKVRQLSNRYEVVEAETAKTDAPKQSSSPYKRSLNNSFIKSLKDDELNEHYRHSEFFEVAKEWNVPKELAQEIFKHIKEYLPSMKNWASLYWSLNRMREYASTISDVGPWFNTVLQRRDSLLMYELQI